MVEHDSLPYTKIAFNNESQTMSALGFGTLIPDAVATKNTTRAALEVGFRFLDTSEHYQTERENGEAIQEAFKGGMIKRKDVFVITKLWDTNHLSEQVNPPSKSVSKYSSSTSSASISSARPSLSNPETTRTRGMQAANPPISMGYSCFGGEGYTAGQDHTTIVVQRHLKRLADITIDENAHPIVRELIAEAANRLHLLCASMLFRRYLRLTRPPLNLQPDELLSSVVERMLKAMREFRPQGVRQFFALATRHMRWELNDLARRLDRESHAQPLNHLAVAPDLNVVTPVTRNARRILRAIGDLPTDERDVFELVRMQGMAQQGAAAMLGISGKTVQRRLNRALRLLSEKLCDLQPLQSDIPQKSYHS